MLSAAWQAAHKAPFECFNQTSVCIKIGREQISSGLGELYSKKLQSYSQHSYGPTVNQLLPGAGRMFKALWDPSDESCGQKAPAAAQYQSAAPLAV